MEAEYDIVHFIDGDVILDSDYLRKIVRFFNVKKVQAVVGQLEEQKPNIYNRLAALMNVGKKAGYAQLTSTGATFLRKPLLSIDGYDERIGRGEESELGERFRKAGYKIWCTEYRMGSHHFGILNIWQYVQKYKKNACSQVQLALFDDNNSYFKTARKRFSNQLIKLILMAAIISYSVWSGKWWLTMLILSMEVINRNKWMIKRHYRSAPFLLSCDLCINLVFYWLWWYGFFQEVYRYFFDKQSKKFYGISKMKLNRQDEQ
jgi:hypothetical protein